MITDPIDYNDKNTNEGDNTTVSSAGQDDSGGKTTQQAEQDYQRAASSHFTSDADIVENSDIKGLKGGKTKVKSRTGTLPQIGSIQDDLQNSTAGEENE